MTFQTATRAGYEPIPGYILRKRLGAGGYGEVWLADAPGGLQKAIKLIYGTVEQSHASSELRSLQRIRQVYHPFLLSLERIEIVDNQVVIITELAESSLLDRFEQCRRKGAPGIDRAALLDFMRDAADALDFLSQKHSLQHLDVKPGNLLIIADRIKVADFGLIKDLHDQNQSLVSGLTPTYSAPEIFDGRPDYRSDQYSLAIVYMEMLSGHLPFPGKTTGELARQHLTQAPNLESLPPADRPIVARALAKNPLDRFGTCRLFIEQLLKTRGAALPNLLKSSDQDSGQSEQDSELRTEQRKTSTTPQLSGELNFQPPMELAGLVKQWVNPRSMFIGLGGMGGRSLTYLRRLALKDCDNRFEPDDHAWAILDTCAASLNQVTDESNPNHVPARYAFEMPLFKPSEYRNAEPELFCPLSRRWLYNIPRSLKTEGVRPLAILTMLDHYASLRKRIESGLRELVTKHEQDADCQEPLRIYLLASLHGGTGGGLLIEVAYLIRRVLCEIGFSNYRLCAMATLATTTNNYMANLHSAAAMATLSELSYTMSGANELPPLHFADQTPLPTNAKPFDWVTLVDGGLHGSSSDAERAVIDMATAAWIDSQTTVGSAMSEQRLQDASKSLGWLRAVCAAPVSVSTNVTSANLARWCCEQTLLHAVTYMNGPRGMATSSTKHCDSDGAGMPTISGDFPLTPQASEDFARRLLIELEITQPDGSLTPITFAEQNPLLDKWKRRISSDENEVKAQLHADLEVWRHAVAKTVKLRVYNWKQIEKIQLHIVEGLVNFYEMNAAELAQQLTAVDCGAGDFSQRTEKIVSYFKSLSEACIRLLQTFQREGKNLTRRIRSWCDSISAEKALNEAPWDVNLSGLSPRMQSLTHRVNSVLESTVHRLATQIVDAAECYERPHEPGAPPTAGSEVNLQYILQLSNDLIVRIAGEMGITAEEFQNASNADDAALSLLQIESFVPAFAPANQLYRFIVAPVEHEQIAGQVLLKHRLDRTTTLLSSRRSLESFVLCEAADVRVQQMVSAQWRPSPTTLQLAERLRTRVDVEWDSASRLLEILDNASYDGSVSPITVAPETGTLQTSVQV